MGSICGAGSTTSTYQPAGLNNLQTIYGTALNAASQPYQPYTGQLVAGLTSTQQSGINNVNASYGMAQPYLNTAANYAQQGAAPVNNVSAGDISQYMSPYNTSVVNATMANINDTNAQQQQQLLGGAAQQGALGGDRVGVAQAELARQQDLASNQTLAGLQNQNYSQALGEANTQQQNEQTNAQRQAQAAFTYGNLGTTAQNAALSGAQAQIGAGTLEQQTNQAGLTAQYQQYLQALAFPYQQSQFLAGIGIPASTAMGGTQTTTPPPPSLISQLGGLGLLGIGLGLRRGGRVPKFADGGATNFMQTPGYIPLGIQISGGQQPQMQNLSQAQTANPMANLTQTAGLMKALGIGPAGNSASTTGGGGGAVMDVGSMGGTGGALGGLFARGGLVEAIHHIRRGLKRYDDGGNVPNGSVWDISTGSMPIFPQAANFGLTGWPSRTSPPDNPMYNPATDTANFVPASTANSDQLGAGLLRKYDPDFPIVTTAPDANATATNVAANPAPNDPEANAGSTDGGPLAYTDQPARGPLNISPFPVPPSMAGNIDQGTLGGTGGLSPNGAPLSPQSGPAMQSGSQGTLPPGGAVNTTRSLFGRPLTDDRMALIAAGLGIMGQRSPYPLMNIGQGGLQGLQALESQRKAAQEDLTVQQRGQQLAQQAEQFAKTFGLQQQEFGLKQGQASLAALAPVKIGQDVWGRDIYATKDPSTGQYRTIDPSTGQFKPQGVPSGAVTPTTGAAPNVAGAVPDAPTSTPTALHGDDYLKTVPPEVQGLVKNIAEYKTDPRTLSTKGGQRERFLAMAAQYNPNFDQINYAERLKAVKDFATGTQGNTVRSMNVGISHLNTLADLATALNNHDVQAVNSISNTIKTQFGVPAPTNFETAKGIVGDEIVKAIVGARGSLADREEAKKVISSAQSPQQLSQAIQTYKSLMAGQLHGLQQQYEGSTGLKDFSSKLSPETLRELGPPGGNAASAPYRVKQNGHTYERQPNGDMKAID